MRLGGYLWVLVGLLGGLGAGPGWAWDGSRGTRGAVATVHPAATQAGMDALRAGGNAVDAAIACALTLGVVDGHNSGIGGGCFFLIRLADGRVVALDGRETAPRRATREMFLRDGRADPSLSQDGPLAAGVPGELAVLARASTNHGRLPLSRLLEQAADLAERGFTLSPGYVARVRESQEALRRLPAAANLLLSPQGDPLPAGTLLRQPDLAATYRALARHGWEWFYGGEFARRTGDWMAANGGLLRAEDFADYLPRERPPVRGRYRGYDIVSFPPPSSGGVHVVEILNLLERFRLRPLGDDSAEFVHLVAEAMKLAFADRAHWLGDPDFARVPRGLVDKKYAAALARRISRERATPVAGHGTPQGADSDWFGRENQRHTTHFSVADGEGNWVAATATVNTSFGSKVVIPGTGVFLNNQMDDFAAQPGVPNYFGLLGAEANAVEARKRPLSSMSPTLVFHRGRPILSVGAAGGPTIISQTVLAILRVIDFGMTPAEALQRPRFHHQWRPDELRIERDGFAPAVLAELERRGHRVVAVGALGSTQAVGRGRDGRQLLGAADPRSGGVAGGW